MSFATKKIAIDLGTSFTRVYVPKKGVVVNEPSVIATEGTSQQSPIIAVGLQAHEMQGKSPGQLHIRKPMQSGVIADYGATTQMIGRFIHQSTGRFHIQKPEAMITISHTATSTEKKALIDSAIEAGLQNVHLIKTSVAAALGAGITITEPKGSMIIDIGAGTTEIGVFSLGGIVTEKSIRIGGENIDDAIRLMARRELGVRFGSEELAKIKCKFLNLKTIENNSLSITGQSIIQGIPKKVTVKQKQLQSYIEGPLTSITRTFKTVLEQTPPDVISDISKHGAVLSGGSSQIRGLGEYLSKQLNIACIVSQDPELASIKGAHMALTHLEDYRRSLLA